MANIKDVLSKTRNAELLSYIINQDPTLKAEIDLPVQGQSIAPIGKLIVSNQRYRNAFLNIVNVIGLTVINSKSWRSPWDEFTEKGTMNLGQTVRELYVDIADVYDYNQYKDDDDHFLENVVPNVYEYMHELNYEKFYKTTTSDEEIAMAFTTEGGLLNLIEKVVASLYEGYEYDKYIVAKYLLCRRMLDGTMAVHTLTADTVRGKVAEMKSISDKMTFRKPNYNPAGVRSFSRFEDQFTILTTDFDGQMSVDVLATSYFRNDAMLRSNLAIVDGFNDHDSARLTELLGSQYQEFTADELTALATVPAVIVDRDFFQIYNYYYDTRATEFMNPESLRTNHWLHTKKVISSSPFAPCCIMTTLSPAVSAVSVSPSSAAVVAGQKLQFTATVTATGFANKAVTWSVDTDAATAKVEINEQGVLYVPATAAVESITVTAKSVFNTSVTGTATVTVSAIPTVAPTTAAPSSAPQQATSPNRSVNK